MTKLKYYRLLAEMSQKKLGKESGCSQALISLLEKEKVFPGKSLKESIAKALEREIDEIFPNHEEVSC